MRVPHIKPALSTLPIPFSSIHTYTHDLFRLLEISFKGLPFHCLDNTSSTHSSPPFSNFDMDLNNMEILISKASKSCR